MAENSLTDTDRLQKKIAELEKEIHELKFSSHLYIETLNSSVDAIIRYDAEGRVEYLNPAFTKLFGWTFDELHGHRIDFVPDEDKEATWATIQKIQGGEKITNFQTRRRTKDGRILYVAMSVASIYDQNGYNLGNVVILRDETERRKMELELHKSRTQYFQLLNASADAIIRYDAEGRVEYLNPAFTKLFGWTFEELQGSRIDFVPDEDKEATWATIQKIQAGEQITNFQSRRKTKDGRILDIAMSVASIFDDGETNIGNVVIIRDETERKKVELALKEAISTAKSANRLKSEFLANMSHEIRTPMNAVIGLTHLALRTDMTPKQRDYLRKIRGSSQALLGIINDILDFSKIEAGKLSLENIEFELQDVLDNLINVISIKSEEKGLELLFSIDRDVPRALKGDPLRLGQVLINLLGNAVKFTEKGEIVFSTELLKKQEDTVRIRFSVKDTGIGIEQKKIETLFKSFSQADGSITRRYGGTGLGLAISKQLVEMMGGFLEVESSPGAGTTFRFILEFKFAEKESAATGLLVPESLWESDVLVVDDNRTSCRILESMLLDFGFNVTVAGSGNEAIGLIEKRFKEGIKPFPIILMDWKMPGIDGIETAKIIKSDPRMKESSSILMITAYGRDEVMQEAENAGLDGFLTKPVGQSVLLNSILEVCGHASVLCSGDGYKPKSDKTVLDGIRGAKVLLVEDNYINRQVAIEFLEQYDFDVDVAVNGAEGVEKAINGKYELVLMDIQMPEMDGLEATRRIRDYGLTDLPIVAMTAHAMNTDRENSLNAGMDDHLTKPIDPKRLEEILIQWIPGGKRTVSVKHREKEPTEMDTTIPDIQGLDTQSGVRHVGGSAQTYLRLLREFSKDIQDSPDLIREHMASGEWDVAERLAHSAKGTSSTMGALKVAEKASLLEKALKNRQQEDADTLLAEFSVLAVPLGQELQAFFNSISSEKDPPPDSVQTVDIKTVILRLERMIGLLDQGDSLAEDIAQELAEELAGHALENSMAMILENIEDVEFEDARYMTENILKDLRGDL